eukprot:gene2390-2854_t
MRTVLICLIVALFFASISAKSTTKCVSSCMKGVKKIPYTKCVRSFKQGKVVRRCGLKGVKRLCSKKCKHGRKQCWNVCKTQNCYGKKVRVCKRKCKVGRSCYKTCVFKKVRSCWYDRTSGKWVNSCKRIWRNVPFRRCLKNCTVTTSSCSRKCSKVLGKSKRYRVCKKYLVSKSATKKVCSLGKYYKKCKKFCRHQKYCKKQCRTSICEGKRVLKCKYVCYRGKSCRNHCTKHKQVRCYISRIPPRYASRCFTAFKRRRVNRCVTKCFKKVRSFQRK